MENQNFLDKAVGFVDRLLGGVRLEVHTGRGQVRVGEGGVETRTALGLKREHEELLLIGAAVVFALFVLK